MESTPLTGTAATPDTAAVGPPIYSVSPTVEFSDLLGQVLVDSHVESSGAEVTPDRKEFDGQKPESDQSSDREKGSENESKNESIARSERESHEPKPNVDADSSEPRAEATRSTFQNESVSDRSENLPRREAQAQSAGETEVSNPTETGSPAESDTSLDQQPGLGLLAEVHGLGQPLPSEGIRSQAALQASNTQAVEATGQSGTGTGNTPQGTVSNPGGQTGSSQVSTGSQLVNPMAVHVAEGMSDGEVATPLPQELGPIRLDPSQARISPTQLPGDTLGQERGGESATGQESGNGSGSGLLGQTQAGMGFAARMQRASTAGQGLGTSGASMASSDSAAGQSEAGPTAGVLRASETTTEAAQRAQAPETPRQAEQAELLERVARMAKFTKNGDKSTARVWLKPPELGSVRLTVSVERGVVSANLAVENQAAREALNHDLTLLQQMLEESGLEVGDLHVGLFGGAPGEGLEAESEQDPNAAKEDSDTSSEGSEGESRIPESPVGHVGPGSVNVIV